MKKKISIKNIIIRILRVGYFISNQVEWEIYFFDFTFSHKDESHTKE